MSLSISTELDIDVLSTHGGLLGQNCREVLLSGLQDMTYTGDFSALTNLPVVDSTITQVSLKIIRLLRHLAALRSVRNLFSHISRLPAEVLLQIFRLRTHRHGTSVDNWLAFSQVSTSWRRLALADPSLWTHLDLTIPRIGELMAQRAQNMAVSLSVTSSKQLLLGCIPERSRVESFTFLQDPKEWYHNIDERLGAYFSGRFSALKSLHLTSDSSSMACDIMPIIDAPVLQTLALRNWFLPYPGAPPTGNLTTLSLSFDCVSASQSWAYDDFHSSRVWDILGDCPRLSSLTLESAVSGLAQEDKRLPGVIIQLPRLRELVISDDVNSLNLLLPKLHLPHLDNLVVHCHQGRIAEIQNLERFPHAVNSCLRGARWPLLAGASFEFGSDLEISAWREGSTRSCDLRRIEIGILDDPSHAHLTVFLQSFIPTFPFSALTTLEVRVDRPSVTVLPLFWASASTLSALQTIMFEGCLCDSFEALLITLCPDLAKCEFEDNIARIADPFPSLRKLELRKLWMFREVHGMPPLLHLVQFLRSRRQQGRHVSVVLDECPTILHSDELCGTEDIHIVSRNEA